MTYHILIAHRDFELGTMIATEIKNDSDRIEVLSDGKKLLQRTRSENVQIIIMDEVLPEISGVELIRQLRKSQDQVAILLLTNDFQETKMTEAIEAGASDFLVSPYQRGQLVSRINALKSRFTTDEENRVQKEGQYVFGPFRLNLNSSDFYQGDVRTHLTPSEFKLLEALFRHRGTILTRDQLIAEVQGQGVVVVDRAIDTHVFSLRKKLGDSAHLIQTVRGIGYRLGE